MSSFGLMVKGIRIKEHSSTQHNTTARIRSYTVMLRSNHNVRSARIENFGHWDDIMSSLMLDRCFDAQPLIT